MSDDLLQATGVGVDGGPRVVIAANEWSDLDWYEVQAQDPVRISRSKVAVDGYEHVKVRSAEVMGLWPPQKPSLATLPDLVVPDKPGHMTLFQAAQWIATKGGTVSFEPSDASTWKDAFDQLLSRVASNEVRVTGVEDGKRRDIEADAFIAIAVDYPFVETPQGLRDSDEIYLRSYPYVDDEHWRAGFDDSLCDRSGARISKLMVAKPDVARCWPFGQIAENTPPLLPKQTGLPGRSSSWHLIEAEFRRRARTGEASRSVPQEAKWLAAWLEREQPQAPRATEKTIANKLRSEHRDCFDLTRNKDSG